MRFQPKTENEMRADDALPEGIYDFTVTSAEEAVSKAGNEMIALRLSVFAPNGSQRTVRDWIVSNAQKKLRGFCEATGLLAEYDEGALEAADLQGRSGKVKLIVETGDFAGNKVAYYVRPAGVAQQPARATAPKPQGAGPKPRGADLDDAIPFGPEVR